MSLAMRQCATTLAVATIIAVAAAITPARSDVRWRHCPALVYGHQSYYGYRYSAYYRPYARRAYEYDHQYGIGGRIICRYSHGFIYCDRTF